MEKFRKYVFRLENIRRNTLVSLECCFRTFCSDKFLCCLMCLIQYLRPIQVNRNLIQRSAHQLNISFVKIKMKFIITFSILFVASALVRWKANKHFFFFQVKLICNNLLSVLSNVGRKGEYKKNYNCERNNSNFRCRKNAWTEGFVEENVIRSIDFQI